MVRVLPHHRESYTRWGGEMTTPLWIKVGSIVCSTILALLFIVGGFFETRRMLRKMKKNR
jgi:hypothetical protein